MTKIKDWNNMLLMHKLSNNGQINLSKWFEKIVDDFCEEKEIEEHTSFNHVKYRFHDDLHDSFLCTIFTLLFKFLIDKGVTHIINPRLPLAIPYCTDWLQRKRDWEKFIKECEWEYFLSK